MDPVDVNAIAHRVITLQAAATPVVGAVGDIAGAVQAVAIKVPTFWPTRPEVWFPSSSPSLPPRTNSG